MQFNRVSENLKFLKQKFRSQADLISSYNVYLQTIKCIDVLLCFRILCTVTDFRNIFKKSEKIFFKFKVKDFKMVQFDKFLKYKMLK